MRSAPFKGNLIVTNLPADMTALRLAELFDSFGLVIGAEIRHIPANVGTGLTTIGVVALAPEDAVERAIEAVNKTMIDQCRVKVGRAKPPQPKPKATLDAKPRRADPVQEPSPVAPLSRPAMPQTEATRPVRKVIVEYKPRRRLIP